MSVESGRVKREDYVMECIRSDIKKRPKSEWITADALSSATEKSEKKKKSKKQLDWWMSLDEEKNVKEPKEGQLGNGGRKSILTNLSTIERRRGVGARAGVVEVALIGGWMYLVARHSSHDSMSGDISKSGGISSTSTMRGTVCYVVPEYSCGGDLLKQCDVHSFGILFGTFMPAKKPCTSAFCERNSGNASGDLELPPLPVECSLSIPSGFRSHRKARDDSEIHPCLKVKENLKKDKIRSKRDKNEKRGEAGKCQKQLQ
nr:receptor-like serine/threonine-protein kinase At2g45590 [Tanacetum cinerariifolium]